jgi:MFS family permease
MQSAQVIAAPPEKSIRKVAVTALAGTSIEFYDFFIYGTAAALIFPKVFFPEGMPRLIALLASFSTFAIGFFARPLGAVIFGHFGDKAGRKTTLVVALLLMGVGTTLIGCLPTYHSVGPLAPLMLIALRFVQGLALGGQWGGAVLIVIESAPRDQRGWYGSFAQVGAPIGTILANLAFLIVTASMSSEALLSWGWRLPFLFSVVLIGLAIFIQLRLEDTPAFRQLQELQQRRLQLRAERMAREKRISVEEANAEIAAERRPSPVLEALRTYPKQIALAAGAFVGMQVSYYIMVAFSIAYATNPAGLNIPTSSMLIAVLLGATAMVPGVFASALISDRYGRRGILMISAVLLGLWAFAIFPLIDTGSLLWISVALCVGQFLNGMLFGPLAALFSEIFTTKVRYSGASLGYQIGTLLGGALAPVVATALLAHYGSPLSIAVYIACACTISLVSVWLLSETYQADMTDAATGRDHDDAQPAGDVPALARSFE